MIVGNEAVGAGIEKIPVVVETALQDLGDYHAGTTIQLRKCLTQSLDVASEAILVDIDSMHYLLHLQLFKNKSYFNFLIKDCSKF